MATASKTPEAKVEAPSDPNKIVNAGGIVLYKTAMHHVFHVDLADNGQYREVAVVKEWPNGSLSYIDIGLIDNVDRGRLKKVLTSGHADKYPLWDLLYMERLANGKNGLDYFHQMVRIKKAPGHVDNVMSGGGSLFDPGVRTESNQIIGSAFSDPASGATDSSGAV